MKLKDFFVLSGLVVMGISSRAAADTAGDAALKAAFAKAAAGVYSDVAQRLTTSPAASQELRDALAAKMPLLRVFLDSGNVSIAADVRDTQGEAVHARAYFRLEPVALTQTAWSWSEVASNWSATQPPSIITMIPAASGAFWTTVTLLPDGALSMSLSGAAAGLPAGKKVTAVCSAVAWNEAGAPMRKWTCRHDRLWGYVLDADLLLPESSAATPALPALRGVQVSRQEKWLDLDRTFWTAALSKAAPNDADLKKLILHEFLRVVDIDDDNALVSWIYEPFPRAGAAVRIKAGAPLVWPNSAAGAAFVVLSYSNNLLVSLAPNGQDAQGWIRGWWYDGDKTVVLVDLGAAPVFGLKRQLYPDGQGGTYYRDALQPLNAGERLYFYLSDMTEIKKVTP